MFISQIMIYIYNLDPNQPLGYVVHDLYGADPTQEPCITYHADCTAPTRQHELRRSCRSRIYLFRYWTDQSDVHNIGSIWSDLSDVHNIGSTGETLNHCPIALRARTTNRVETHLRGSSICLNQGTKQPNPSSRVGNHERRKFLIYTAAQDIRSAPSERTDDVHNLYYLFLLQVMI